MTGRTRDGRDLVGCKLWLNPLKQLGENNENRTTSRTVDWTELALFEISAPPIGSAGQRRSSVGGDFRMPPT